MIPSGYDLELTVRWYRWPIEIDGLPGLTELKNGGSFHGYVSHNQIVYSNVLTILCAK